MINHPPGMVPVRFRAGAHTLWRNRRGRAAMTVSRDSAGATVVGRKAVFALGIVGLLTTLGACAGENVGGSAAASAAPAAAPAAAAPAAPPAPASTTAAAAPKPAPSVLTATEINEQCWMTSEVNKMKDLDAKARYVDKCVAEKMKAQGM
jgi:hypothetical protein